MNVLEWETWRSLWLNRRTLLVTAMIACLLLATLDFYVRVWVARDSTLRQFTVPKLPAIPSALAVDLVDKQFARWMPVPVPPPPPPPPPPELRLQGILGAGPQIRASLVLVEASGVVAARFLVAKGEPVQDWVVQRVDRKSVQLKRGGETKDLLLFPSRVE